MIKSNIASVPASGIRKYFDLLNEMEDVISLGIGEPDFVTPFSIMQAAHTAMDRGHTHYSSNMGFISLREENREIHEERYGLSYCPKDEILVTVGASEAIDLALRCLLGPGMRSLFGAILRSLQRVRYLHGGDRGYGGFG